jgi:hypothetical protein
MSTQGDPFASDNAMRKAARERGLRVNKDRDKRWNKGVWHIMHMVTRERLSRGSRDEIAAFIAAYNPGEERLNIIRAIPIVITVAPMIDWPDVREDDDSYVWGDLEGTQKALADYEPNPTFVHPKPPPESKAEIPGFRFHFAPKEWMDARGNLSRLYLGDLSSLKTIEDAGERRRAFAEAGRLRFYVDYVLEHRATWSAIEAEQKAIAREANIIAGLRTDAGRHTENSALTAKRYEQADKREAKLAERKAELDKRLGVREERHYWWPHIREALDGIKHLQNDIVAGYHTDNLTDIQERLGELTRLIERTNLLALDGDLRERTRKVRASDARKRKIETTDTEEEAS